GEVRRGRLGRAQGQARLLRLFRRAPGADTMKRGLLAVALMALLLPAVAQAQAVFIARKAVQRIHRMVEEQQPGQPSRDFAMVMLEVPAARVFAVALERAKENRAIRITSVEPDTRRLQVTDGPHTATLNVIEFNDGLSQLVIAGSSPPGEPATSSRVVAAVMRICAEMKKTCELAR